MSDRPRLLVVVPPHASSMANGPPLAPLLLHYYLDGCGIDVELFDANARFFRWLLRPEARDALRDELHDRLARQLTAGCLSSDDLTRVGRLFSFSLSEYCRGAQLSFARSGFDWGAVHELVLGEDDAFGRRIWSSAMDELASQILDTQPDHLAFSVLFHEQCAAMIELCKRVRASGFGGRIILGGAAIKLSDDPYLGHLLSECSADIAYRFNLYSSMGPVAELLAGARLPSEVPDASYLDDGDQLRHVGAEHQRVRTLAGALTYDIVDPTPYFPEQIYPVLLSEGCYWGKCDFCDYPFLASQDPFTISALFRDPSVVVADVCTIVDRFGVREIDLISDAVPLGYFPRLVRAEAGRLRERGVRMECSIRAEPKAAAHHFEAMAQCGVDRVTIGVEALSDEVLAGMQKGNTYADVMRSVELAKASGIKVKANLIYDYPRIRMRHIPEMMDRLAEITPSLDSLAVHSFGLTPHSPLANRPQSAGLVVLGGTRRDVNDHGHHHLEFRREDQEPELPDALDRFREAVEAASYEIDVRHGRVPGAEQVIPLPFRWDDGRALRDPDASDLMLCVPGEQTPFSFFVGEYSP